MGPTSVENRGSHRSSWCWKENPIMEEYVERQRGNKYNNVNANFAEMVWNGFMLLPFVLLSINTFCLLNSCREDAKDPSFWSRVCLHNMANLAKDGTSIRRVMEPLFRYFDNGSLWTIDHGLAFYVLKDMLFSIDDSGIIFFILDFISIYWELSIQCIDYFIKSVFKSLFSFWFLQGKTRMFYCQY